MAIVHEFVGCGVLLGPHMRGKLGEQLACLAISNHNSETNADGGDQEVLDLPL